MKKAKKFFSTVMESSLVSYLMRVCFLLGFLITLTVFIGTTADATSILIEPSPYLSFEDSPFFGLSLEYFHLEDFEDDLLNTPGVTVNTGRPVGPEDFGQYIDSVDADDGIIDGVAWNAHSFVTHSANTFVFSFDSDVLGRLPTHVGIVWTDSEGTGNVTFEAFDAYDVSLGIIGPVPLGDGTNRSSTAEDRFFGIININGISRFEITNYAGLNWEVDHLQYGLELSSCTDPDNDCILDDGDDSGVPGDNPCTTGTITDCDDNCPNKPNSPYGGTCTEGENDLLTRLCINNSDCGLTDGFCSMNQEDTDEDGIGDACDICLGNLNCDDNCDAIDIEIFLEHFGRNPFNRPCTNDEDCPGDFTCDKDVDAEDVVDFLECFGRSIVNNPCPPINCGPWCDYPDTTTTTTI